MAEELIYKVGVEGTNELNKLEQKVTDTGKATNKTTLHMAELRRELRVVRGEMIKNEKGTDAYNKALARGSQIMGDIDKANSAMRAGIQDIGRTTRNVTGAMVGFAGGFQVVQSAMSLFGIENEETIKTVLKLQQTMSIVQGMAGFAKGLSDMQDLLASFRASNDKTVEVAADLSGSMDNTGKSMEGASDSAEGLSDTVIETSSNLAGATNAADETSKGMNNLDSSFKGLTGSNKELMDSLSASGGQFDQYKESVAKANVEMLENDLAILKSGEDFESLNDITNKVITANGGHEKSIESITAAMEKEIDSNKSIIEGLNQKTEGLEKTAKATDTLDKSTKKLDKSVGTFGKSVAKSLGTMVAFLAIIALVTWGISELIK